MIAEATRPNAETCRELVRKCWLDSEFEQRLLADPATVLREEGWEIPEEAEGQVLESLMVLTPRNGTALGVAEVPDSLLGQVYGRSPEPTRTHATRCAACFLPLPSQG